MGMEGAGGRTREDEGRPLSPRHGERGDRGMGGPLVPPRTRSGAYARVRPGEAVGCGAQRHTWKRSGVLDARPPPTVQPTRHNNPISSLISSLSQHRNATR